MSLDDKLAKAILSVDFEQSSVIEGEKLLNKAIAQIKQVFADEGYVQLPMTEIVTRYERGKKPEVYMVNGKEVMTGREWYERFEKELDDEFHQFSKPSEVTGTYYDAENVLKAAKRATRLDTKQ